MQVRYILGLVLALASLLSACVEEVVNNALPDWSGRERDERLLGKWYYTRDLRTRKTPIYQFYPDGSMTDLYFADVVKQQYYTSDSTIHIAFKTKEDSYPENRKIYYRIVNDTLHLRYDNDSSRYSFARTPNTR